MSVKTGQRLPSEKLEGGTIDRVPLREGGVWWEEAVQEFEEYLEKTDGQRLVFSGVGESNDGDLMTLPRTHRWKTSYTKKQYAKFHDFVRGAREEYDEPHLVMLPALTAATTTPTGEFRHPAEHFDSIKRAWSRYVRYELDHVLKADRKKDDYAPVPGEYITIYEPTTDSGDVPGGYAHCHPVIVVDGEVTAERFASVVEKYVAKNEWASPAAHDPSETDVTPLDGFGNPAAYLFKYLSKQWTQDDVPEYQRRFDALLKMTGYRRFQPSDGAQRWMQPEQEEPDADVTEWKFEGVTEGAKAVTLEELGTVEALQVEFEQSVSSFLASADPIGAVYADQVEAVGGSECYHDELKHGVCVKCGLNVLDLVAGGSGYQGPGPPAG